MRPERHRTADGNPGTNRVFRRSLVIAATVLLQIAFLSILPVHAVQLSEADRVRLAAFGYLTTDLFPADPESGLPYCVEVRSETELDAPPIDAGEDPSAALLASFRDLIRDVTVASECPEASHTDVGETDVSPVLYMVGMPVQSGSGMRVAVAYRVEGLHGGGWVCDVDLAGRAWKVTGCMPSWISAP
jgi:hypothetical protein